MINQDIKFDVVVPVKNEADHLSAVLDALVKEKSCGCINTIVVVDNYSTDDSYAIAKKYVDDVVQAKGNVSQVRNYGSNFVKTDFIAFVDGDVVVSAGWSKGVADYINSHSGERKQMIFGSIYGVPEVRNWVESVWFNSLTSRNILNYINGGNLVVSRQLFEKIGGFDASLQSGEDIDLCKRAVSGGATLSMVGGMETIHLGYPKTISAFFSRERWHGQTMKLQLKRPFTDRALLFAIYHWLLIFTVAPIVWFWTLKGAIILLSIYGSVVLTLAIFRLRQFSHQVFPLAFLFSVYGWARALALAESLVDEYFLLASNEVRSPRES